MNLQDEHHLLLQSLQRAEQSRLHLAAVMLMVNLGSLHRQDVLVVELVEFHHSLDVTLFVFVSVLVCTQTNRVIKEKKEEQKKETPQGLVLKLIQEVENVWKSHLYSCPGTFSLPELHLSEPVCSCSSVSLAQCRSPLKKQYFKIKFRK